VPISTSHVLWGPLPAGAVVALEGSPVTMTIRTYMVIYERDEEGWWVAGVPDAPGCHTQGRTIEQARERILDALSLYAEDATEILLREEARGPGTAA
jgi:predicted RNase H-like HicB family nuclease